MAILKAQELHFSYGDHQVLKGVDFTLKSGNLTFILGANGCGKSTLFTCMLGHRKLEKGYVTIDSEDTATMDGSTLAHRIAYIPQVSAPTFNYSVLQAVLMGRTSHMKLFSTPSKEDMKIAYASLERLGISHLADKGCNKISGGEQQLVLIARALAQQSEIIIMDEPTSSLDYGNQLKVLSQLKSLCKEGKLIVLSSHNPQHALTYADDVVVLNNGKVLEQGRPNEVITKETIRRIYAVDVDIIPYCDTNGLQTQVVVPLTEVL